MTSLPILLTIIFIVLKCCKLIVWSWIWVLCPIWIPLAILGVIAIIGFILAAISR
jgi:hypothetical protein